MGFKLMDEFIKKFKIKELLILRTNYWTWSVRPDQATIGSTIISLNRKENCFSNISNLESADYMNILKIAELTTKHVFNFQKINYLTLMMVDNYLHTHVIPRYSSTKCFFDKKWTDIGWPGQPDLSTTQQTNTDTKTIKLLLSSSFIDNSHKT